MRVFHAAALAAMVSAPALANDTTAQLGTGGLVFVTNDTISMTSEHLFVSPTEIKVVYEFNNTSSEPQHILVAFPMPDIEGSPESMVAIPVEEAAYNGEAVSDPNNIFNFRTTFNGAPVAAELHQYAFKNNIDYTKQLTKLGVPLLPFGEATYAALAGLSDTALADLRHRGMVYGMDYDDGEGPKTDYAPIWTLRSTYSWEATFPPGTSEVIHTYTPSIGGTVAASFMPHSEEDDYSAEQLAEYRKKYCMDDAFIAAVERTAIEEDGWTNYPFTESWISYIWSTGNNWAGPIGTFTLTVDKGSSDSLVSFCGENVKKIGPTTFEMTANDWYPPWDQELEILLLNRVDWYDE
ncbi:MAG: DUF4424 domain-containing protein [Devosia sp.]|uniref:DUF4424 domain-containing protein n=1 Tax=Devosia sp. TaxID=1871048 RepID=UPI0024CC9BAF|nr:DUF4424 domain-containing protein [Devosia sp.]UYO00751.1 MAG: DUF4424 domain-containing protein [Devosia sp.]